MKEEFKACFVSVTYKAGFELLFHIKVRKPLHGFPDFNPESRFFEQLRKNRAKRN
ncbi:MAG: hypothetical protein GY749_33630 [Desulfobacteraceae bacterium]|nr:hypothetical protein [Desulfobacteraceae bacterium]